ETFGWHPGVLVDPRRRLRLLAVDAELRAAVRAPAERVAGLLVPPNESVLRNRQERESLATRLLHLETRALPPDDEERVRVELVASGISRELVRREFREDDRFRLESLPGVLGCDRAQDVPHHPGSRVRVGHDRGSVSPVFTRVENRPEPFVGAAV